MNPMDMLKNFGNIQETLKISQEKMKAIRVTGVAGGDMIKVTISGDMQVLEVNISPDIIDPSDSGTLEDLVKAAVSDALARLREQFFDQVGDMGANIPPNFMT